MTNSEKRKKGRLLEKNYEWLWKFGINKNCIITSPKYYEDKVTGEQREIDVFIEVLDEQRNIIEKIMVECRNREKVQDVTWVEQVVTKRNDLGIDRAIMVTASSFTEPAKIKAKHYNIEVERASPQSKQFINEQQKSCTGIAHFIMMECQSLMIITTKGCYNHKQLLNYPNIRNYVKSQIIEYSQSDYFATEIQEKQISKKYKNFFTNSNNYIEMNASFVPQHIKYNIATMANCNSFNSELGKIEKIYFSLKITPKFISFPLIRVITIFDDDIIDQRKSNKRHKSSYENDKIKITFQIHEDKMYNELTLKKPNIYWRYCGLNITLYALLGNIDTEKVEFYFTNTPQEMLGSIYFGNIE